MTLESVLAFISNPQWDWTLLQRCLTAPFPQSSEKTAFFSDVGGLLRSHPLCFYACVLALLPLSCGLLLFFALRRSRKGWL